MENFYQSSIDPAPAIVLSELSDSPVNFTVGVWVNAEITCRCSSR